MLNTNTALTFPTNQPQAGKSASSAEDFRLQQINDLAICIGAESELPADVSMWRDAFCHECETNECLNGTAKQLAQKILDRGWAVEDLKQLNLICPRCQDAEPMVDGFWAEAEDRYERWKSDRFED